MRSHPRSRPGLRPSVERLEDRTLPSVNLVESEPNNSPAAADAVGRLLLTPVLVDGRVGTAGDRDWFRFDLEAGDVFGAAVRSQGSLNPMLRLFDSAGSLLFANDDLDNPYHPTWGQSWLPAESPLPSAHIRTDAEVSYIVSTAGAYFLEVSASADATTGRYELDTMVARPGMEAKAAGTRQIVFLDFDGADVNFNNWPGKDAGGTRHLSPLSSFLPAWGLTAADENAVIDAILARVTENLSIYVGTNGVNDNFGLQILNSRDHPDRFGIDPLVSRVVVGGTEAEAKLSSWGKAQYVDVGNFKTDDDAVATLSFVKGGLDLPNHLPNQVIDFIGLGVATLILHEVGHNLGCYHTHNVTGLGSLMDTNIGSSLGWSLGPDGMFGTADDLDIRYTVDDYLTTDEPYRGREDTLNTIAFGLSMGKQAAALHAATAGTSHSGISLRSSQVRPLLAEALRRWQTAGVDTSALQSIDIRIDNLGGNILGQASGHTIYLDDNAAGWGWFVDRTPRNDSEFTRRAKKGEQNRMDLLTVLEHEVGHLLGYEHEATGVMTDTLPAGTRRTPVSATSIAATHGVDWFSVVAELAATTTLKRR